MPRYDFTSQRLHVEHDLAHSTRVELNRAQANYLLNVLRLGDGDHVLLFNGRDGEWRANLHPVGRKKAHLEVVSQTRAQPTASDLLYLFAPLKQARMEYMVQKAVEMGAGVLQPVFTQYTQLRKLNHERMEAQTIEAAEQCGILSLPHLAGGLPLMQAIENMSTDRLLIFCDEGEESQNPLPPLAQVSKDSPLAVLVGPEGGFSEEERGLIRALPNAIPIPLGPRVLRADTAAVAALAVVQATVGDWS
ncbi:MAG: 16S rRNA (uracil(1498)-N(3))-methyltransferase [Pseudomonadota bacterium]